MHICGSFTVKVEVIKQTVAFRSAYSYSKDIRMSDVMVTCNPKKRNLLHCLRAVFQALQVTFLLPISKTLFSLLGKCLSVPTLTCISQNLFVQLMRKHPIWQRPLKYRCFPWISEYLHYWRTVFPYVRGALGNSSADTDVTWSKIAQPALDGSYLWRACCTLLQIHQI